MTFFRIALFLLLPAITTADGIDGRAYFKAGVDFFDSKKYPEAIESFSSSHEKLPIIGDYSLLYMSKAYIKTGDLEKSNKCLEQLLKEYPQTPLKKTARALLIKNTVEADREKAEALLEVYIRDYPNDEGMRFLLGELLKDKDKARAKEIFRELYIGAGSLDMKASREIEPEEVSVPELIKRGSNLIYAGRYKEAESMLKAIRLAKGSGHKKGFLETLALSLFRQKQYEEAGETYMEASNFYEAGVAFLRAEKYDAFDRALAKVVSMKDERAGGLLISSSIAKRREGNTEEALRLLSKVKATYPAHAEQALWHTGWTYYLSGDYKSAIGIFSELYKAYGDTKYLYWNARAIENEGGNPTHIYKGLESKDGFYSILSGLRNSKNLNASGDSNIQGDMSIGGVEDAVGFERPDILLEAGLKGEAVMELMHMSKNVISDKELIGIAYKINSMGEYRKAIGMVSILSKETKPDEILYPLAYWQSIKEQSSIYGIDPLLVLSLIREESRFDPEACSQAGAIGIMQIMPETARRLADKLGIKLKGTEHIYDVELNLKLGMYYLWRLLEEFGSATHAIAAYNAGEHRVRQWLGKQKYQSYDEFIEDIPYQETSQYIKRILTTYYIYKGRISLEGKSTRRDKDSDRDPFNLLVSHGIIMQ
ncbi:MAG: transglycosylase SLT domain-containing protein [Nitrospirae bacterium]|nr:transglycosylase SLT domain-containing protein [Nitrospirota bacterium]